MKVKDYGSEYPYLPFRRQIRKQLIAMAVATATILVFMAVLIVSICLLPGAIDNEVSRQVAQVEKSLGVKP
jgi:hypothetical protein